MKELLDRYGKTIPINDATRYHDLLDEPKAQHIGAITNFKNNVCQLPSLCHSLTHVHPVCLVALTHSLTHSLTNQLAECERRIDDKLDAMKRTVKKNFERLDNEVRLERLKLDEGVLIDEKAVEGDGPKEAKKVLDAIEKQMDAFKAQTAILKGYQKLFFDYQMAKYHVEEMKAAAAAAAAASAAAADGEDEDGVRAQSLAVQQQQLQRKFDRKPTALDKKQSAAAGPNAAGAGAGMQFEPLELKLLPETERVFERKKRFWEKYDEWLTKWQSWEHGRFLLPTPPPAPAGGAVAPAAAGAQALDVEAMDRDVKELYTTIHSIAREADREAKRDAGNAPNAEAKDAAVLNKVKNMINDVRNVMPLVVDLGTCVVCRVVGWV